MDLFPKATLSLKHPVQQRVKLNETLRCCDKFHFMRQKLIRINKRFPNFSKAVQVIYLFVFPNFDTLFETALDLVTFFLALYTQDSLIIMGCPHFVVRVNYIIVHTPANFALMSQTVGIKQF